ncbi:ethanolamine kinase-like isoform X2 [Agrilus planipennis]|uniref:ethanolamine kinase n=1 Tax=Agrilus planipennis TaxID=224129 RepID=A0A7F5R566_AGRPL|nr:ethanolamine kinase-like isoform X2 [Agrilus planipennis]
MTIVSSKFCLLRVVCFFAHVRCVFISYNGITNKLVKCRLEGEKEENSVLVRVYGHKTDLLIDRKAETRNIKLLNREGLAPSLYATFSNGLAYEFVPGCTLNCNSVGQPTTYKMVARHLAKLHKVREGVNNGEHAPILWDKLTNFLNLVPHKFSDPVKQERYESLVLPKEQLRKEIEYLKENLTQINSPVVFCHNDLLLGNVICTDDESSVVFIDYEYAAYNYQAFDIGNHFNEFVGIEPDTIDYSKYPSKELQYDWLKTYLLEFKNTDSVKDEDIYKLYIQVNKFSLTSHLFWGIWALIQAEHSYIDFDFIKYGAIRINEYLAKKEDFLNLDGNETSS